MASLSRFIEADGSQCRLDTQRLVDRLDARLDLSIVSGKVSIEELRTKHQGRAGLALILIEDWRREFESGNLEKAQERMSSLLENHAREKEVRQIASEWGDWLERNNNWAGAASHLRKLHWVVGKQLPFMRSKAGRAYRLAGNREASLTMMRMAQQRAAQEMNASGLKKICDYWWRQWLQGDESLSKEVRSCHRVLLEDRLGERCRALTRVWSVELRELGRGSHFRLRLSASKQRIVRRLAGRHFRKVRSVIVELEALKIPAETDGSVASRYLIRLKKFAGACGKLYAVPTLSPPGSGCLGAGVLLRPLSRGSLRRPHAAR